eukprot:5775867-Pyramimonas_sp.AAC.1
MGIVHGGVESRHCSSQDGQGIVRSDAVQYLLSAASRGQLSASPPIEPSTSQRARSASVSPSGSIAPRGSERLPTPQ